MTSRKSLFRIEGFVDARHSILCNRSENSFCVEYIHEQKKGSDTASSEEMLRSEIVRYARVHSSYCTVVIFMK